MNDDRVTALAQDLDVTLAAGEPLAGSMSGSRVHAVTRPDGGAAVLKVTIASAGSAREAAERELDVYLHLGSRIGVRTPQLLGHRKSTDAIALLLTARPAPRPAQQWRHSDWLHLADDLARLHGTPVPADPRWRRPHWLGATLTEPDLARADAFWCWPGEHELIRPILTDTQPLQDAMNTLADCFLHGDCHTDNVVIEDSHLIWLDWQGAGAGNPAAELAFPSVRATPSGASLPQQEMLDRYAGDRDLDSARVSRATLAAELAIFLLTWPEYASYNTDTGIGRVHRHVQQLARRWLAGQ
jgi:Ser/Thr protein kinase RdoA (MazF antagonist)